MSQYPQFFINESEKNYINASTDQMEIVNLSLMH